uniref:Peroxin-5 n=1 Tax=Setaria digitata TaxID=48799 RepID=A0A915PN88_9BILA
MASTSLGKSLVEIDCTQRNPLVDLSRRVIEGSTKDDFDKTWDQFLASSSSPQNLHDEYLEKLTMSTKIPKTTNLYELVDQVDSMQNLAELWTEEYITEQQQTKDLVEQWAKEAEQEGYLPEQWAEEFSSLNFHEQKDGYKIKDESEMWAAEFLDEFDQKLQMDEFATKAGGCNIKFTETEASTKKFPKRQWSSLDVSEVYIFEKNNPYFNELGAFEKGQQALIDGLITDAILYFEAAVQQNQGNFEGWYLLGKCQTENENDRRSIAAYKTAIKLQPDQREIQLALATAYINEYMELEALEILKEWITSYMDSDSAPFELQTAPTNLIEDLMLRIEQIENLIQKVLSKSDTANKGVFHNALSLVYNMKGDYDRAAEEVKLALMDNPKDYVLWNRLGATLANGKHAAKAVVAYREALEICPNYTRARCNLGIACIQLRNYREAIEHFITALQLQQSYSSISSSTVWSPLRAAVVRSHLPCALDLLAAVNEQDLEKCIHLLN